MNIVKTKIMTYKGDEYSKYKYNDWCVRWIK